LTLTGCKSEEAATTTTETTTETTSIVIAAQHTSRLLCAPKTLSIARAQTRAASSLPQRA
jgi:hypothetical protein